MTIAFDLISDLHLETWNSFDWTGQATSPICVVAGDVARDRILLRQTLEHLGTCYQAVFYIDGNDEHRYCLDNLDYSYIDLMKSLEDIPNVTVLQDNVIVIDGVAIIGTNGWWGFDFDHTLDIEESKTWMQQVYQEKMPTVSVDTESIENFSKVDAVYLVNGIKRLQTHQDVKKIVVITHTVPDPALIQHDLDLDGQYHFNIMGNSLCQLVFDYDTEQKIDTWCFGHYHHNIDRRLNGVRYVNNCRGRGNADQFDQPYYPKRIVIEV